MFLLWSVCLSVCQSENWKSCERILTTFLGRVRHGPGTNKFNFGDDPDHRPDPGVQSPKSAFTGLSKKLPMEFDEILRRAGVWPRDQLITFWWWSASLSGSGSLFQGDPDPGRTATLLTHRADNLQKSFTNSIMLAFGRRLCSLEYFYARSLKCPLNQPRCLDMSVIGKLSLITGASCKADNNNKYSNLTTNKWRN